MNYNTRSLGGVAQQWGPVRRPRHPWLPGLRRLRESRRTLERWAKEYTSSALTGFAFPESRVANQRRANAPDPGAARRHPGAPRTQPRLRQQLDRWQQPLDVGTAAVGIARREAAGACCFVLSVSGPSLGARLCSDTARACRAGLQTDAPRSGAGAVNGTTRPSARQDAQRLVGEEC